jgi:hypothetical protein
MEKTIGKVIDIYIPQQYKNNSILDVMDRTNITFKIQTNEKVEEITVEQNDDNANIMKDDIVEIIKQTISNKNFFDIRLYDGENYE